MELILPFAQLRKWDISVVGGQGANLGEMTHAKIPVPTGYVVTVSAYDEFLAATGMRAKLEPLLVRLDPADESAAEVAAEIRTFIANA